MHANREVIQVAFDWYGYHLHSFETICGEFGSPDDDDDVSDWTDETTAALAQVAAAERAKVVYVYDFGDDWRHDIVVEKIMPAEPGMAYPRCTGGCRRLPAASSLRRSPSYPNLFSVFVLFGLLGIPQFPDAVCHGHQHRQASDGSAHAGSRAGKWQ